jgi:hypothetical protein
MIDHAQLPSVANAKLPETYERAKTALAECSTIDECQSWADKAEALASYARMSDDDSLRKMADRIQARAIRRCGELLRQIEPSKGGRPSQITTDAADSSFTRKSAAEQAGLSERQQYTALRVANVPEQQFNESVESESPPTVTKLAEMGTKKQLIDLKGRDPSHFNKALHFVGDIQNYLRKCSAFDVAGTVSILNDSEREEVRQAINKIDAIHDLIITRI